ncbi:MAG: nucleotidyltransferase substrate binding protein [Candidatus Paracaedibacteraceae bacterium]|nr:nucleotidyltransferase substrate binding protein [Candidatus Paracaedibacteraceae bacterium]
MEKEFWIDSLNKLGKAVGRLDELVNMPGIDTLDYLRDATIQRFEFTSELYWKVLRKILAYEGLSAVTPRDVLKSSYQAGLITGDAIWLKMLDDRNKTSHVYAEEIIIEIFNRIRHDYIPVFISNYKNLAEKYTNSKSTGVTA